MKIREYAVDNLGCAYCAKKYSMKVLKCLVY